MRERARARCLLLVALWLALATSPWVISAARACAAVGATDGLVVAPCPPSAAGQPERLPPQRPTASHPTGVALSPGAGIVVALVAVLLAIGAYTVLRRALASQRAGGWLHWHPRVRAPLAPAAPVA